VSEDDNLNDIKTNRYDITGNPFSY
jgi:hypothetical protein